MTGAPESLVVRLTDESGVGEARRAARRAARELGLGQVETEQAAIVAAEASRNVVLHGRGGLIVVTTDATSTALDILALDRGPGIAGPPQRHAGRVTRPAAPPGRGSGPWRG